MKIQITQEHIDRGIQDSCRDCPTALALEEVINKFQFPVVRRNFISLHSLGPGPVHDPVQFVTPQIVKDFIESFDNNLLVQPIEFELDIPKDFRRGQ